VKNSDTNHLQVSITPTLKENQIFIPGRKRKTNKKQRRKRPLGAIRKK
jgi:hypothetical protein